MQELMTLDNNLANKTAQELHNMAVICENAKTVGTLGQSAVWYELNKTEGYKTLGFSSIYQYVFTHFGKGKKTVQKILSIYNTFVLNHNREQEELNYLGWGKLSPLCSVVNDENIDDLLIKSKDMTQKDVVEMVKDMQGLSPIEGPADDGLIKMTFKMPKEVADVVKGALIEATDEYANETGKLIDDIIPFQALELICINYYNMFDRVNNDPRVTLNQTIENLSKIYNVEVSYTECNND